MIDLSRFQETYFQECVELLGEIEELLLGCADATPDQETLNALFRAVHSIKGGGGAFGFTDLVQFAHAYETLLDELRAGRIAADSDAISLLIRARDALEGFVQAAQTGGPPPNGAAALRVQLAAAAGAGGGGAAIEAPAAARGGPPPGAAAAGGARRVTIHFAPHADLFTKANEPLLLFRELLSLGLLRMTVDMSTVPALDALDPDAAYLSWTLDLETEALPTAVREVFEFVDGDCRLRIDDPLADAPPPATETASAPPTENAGWGLFDDALGAPPSPAPAAAPPPPPTAPAAVRSTIRVDLDKVDRLVNMVGEIVITQAMLNERVAANDAEAGGLAEGIEALAGHTRGLQEAVMAIRAQPVKLVFARMNRLVHDVSAQLGKSIKLVLSGEDTEIDKTVVEQIADPLTHMMRNAMDHGLESPDERSRAGKARRGLIHLSASQRGGRIVIEVADDGRGIDRARVRRKAEERGLIAAEAELSEGEIDNLIFAPGFSTAESVSDISGRGVGMDVVRRNVQALGGRIAVQSQPGEGSRFTLSLPLTLAVLDGMIIRVGVETFVLPVVSIIETLRPAPRDVERLVGRADVLRIRDAYLPLIPLGGVFGVDGACADPSQGLVVIVEVDGGRRVGLVIDEMVVQQQVVVKSLERNYDAVDGLSGATILGDGRVALIIDAASVDQLWRAGEAAAIARPAAQDGAR